MSEPFDRRTRARVQALHAYTIALEQGDIEILAHVLRQAEQDAILERMILELHAVLGPSQPGYQLDPATLDQDEVAVERGPIMISGYPDVNDTPSRPRGESRAEKHRATRLQTLVAIFIVGALVGSFILLLAHYPGATGHGRPVSPVTRQKQTPAPADQNFYIATSSNKGVVYALQARTGKVVWSYNIQKEVDMLVQQGDFLYVSSMSNAYQDYLYKFRLDDGNLLWEKYYPQLEGYSVIVVDGDTIAISGGEGNSSVDIVSGRNGSLLWRYTPSLSSGSIPADSIIAEHQQVLYIRTSSGMEAMQFATGKRLWTSPVSPANLIFAGQTLYAINSEIQNNSQSVIRLDSVTGKELRSWPLPSGASILGVDDDATTLYIDRGGQMGTRNQICAQRLSDGAQIWCLPATSNSLLIIPAVTSPGIFAYIQVASGQQQWVANAINASNGAPRWHWTDGKGISEMNDLNIVTHAGIIFVTTPQGLYALASSDGHILWHALKAGGLSLFALPSVPDQTLQLPD